MILQTNIRQRVRLSSNARLGTLFISPNIPTFCRHTQAYYVAEESGDCLRGFMDFLCFAPDSVYSLDEVIYTSFLASEGWKVISLSFQPPCLMEVVNGVF